jgi:hypothetical protein
MGWASGEGKKKRKVSIRIIAAVRDHDILRHLILSNISIPIKSQLLRQAEGLITLRLWNAPASPEFNPAYLIAQLLGMSHLETLMVQFHMPVPKQIFKSPAQLIPIMLPSLKA